MYDAFLQDSGKIQMRDLKLKLLNGHEISAPKAYYYLTCHREENTGDDRSRTEILEAMNSLEAPTVYPMHPRNKSRALRLQNEHLYRNILLVEPVGYIESICLVNHAKKFVSDSGGLQREAFFAGKKCVTILNFVCWPETMVCSRNELASPDRNDILEKLSHSQSVDSDYKPFGDGRSAELIVDAISKNRFL
jgi:UDP-N-acetylglucosamine 2-epimerase (non-hydrolysing)/UDP-GlcNAc3NAcA epimerase